MKVSQRVLSNLAQNHEPEASRSPQKYRMATCAACGKRMIRMYHCWFVDGNMTKELHLCRRCWKLYAR